jgi:hypothetical protein
MLIGIPQMLGLIVAPGQYVRPRIRITQLASDAIDLAQHPEAFEETDPDGKPVIDGRGLADRTDVMSNPRSASRIPSS